MQRQSLSRLPAPPHSPVRLLPFRRRLGRSCALVLFCLLALAPASAQINALSPTETANVQLVINNLDSLISDGTALLPANPTTEEEQAQKDNAEKELQKMKDVLANLKAKFNGKKIKSIPGLKNGRPKKYKHDGDKPSSPTAAYCDDATSVLVNGQWVKCTEGDIIVDSDTLDPNNGQPINENTQAGWQQKWTLLHILFHEKMHEVMITEQIEELKKRPWWKDKTPEQQQAAIDEAKRNAATAEKHQQVYEWQKNVLRWKRAVLERELRRLKAQAPPDNTAINAVKDKIKWLKAEVGRLEVKMARATASDEFVAAIPGWPRGREESLIRFYITSPGEYWRLDVVVRDGMPPQRSIAETAWLGSLERENPLPQPPAICVTMSETVYSALHCQPDPGEYLAWSLQQGQIRSVKSPAELDSLLPAPLFALSQGRVDTNGGLLERDEPPRAVSNNLSTGLTTTEFPTSRGKVRIYLPDDMAAGDTISGTVALLPDGKTEQEQARNQDELSGYVMEVAHQSASAGKTSGRWIIPVAVSAITLLLRDGHGKQVGEQQVPVHAVAPARRQEFRLPRLGQAARPLAIQGPFGGDLSTTGVKVGGQDCPVLAESPRQTVVLAPRDVIGPTEIEVTKEQQQTKGPFRCLTFNLVAGKTVLTHGEQTTVTFTIRGLQGLTSPVRLLLVNRSPQVVQMTGGTVITLIVTPDQVAPDGSCIKTIGLTGVGKGSFVISAQLPDSRSEEPPR